MSNKDNFIMLPTNDFCFKELMQNPKVRKGFIAGILRKDPEEITDTILLPTETRRDYADDKLSILDVRVRLSDGTQMDLEMQVEYFAFWDKRVLFYLAKMYTGQIQRGNGYDKLKKCIHVGVLNFIYFPDNEDCYHKINLCNSKTGEVYSDLFELHVLELPKLPQVLVRIEQGEKVSGESIIQWMEFFSGKTQEEFEAMAKQNEYMEEAVNTLFELSADEKKRLEYEAREKAIRDYNTQMYSAEQRGMQRGIEITRRILKLKTEGKSAEQIAEKCDLPLEQIKEIMEW
ncbi:MAG: Rpn family recombination-promoting nuclease/putative transposase [bacterium]|nr:Rpn family recombination-promoting nuclease/putative transposase [bacterium]